MNQSVAVTAQGFVLVSSLNSSWWGRSNFGQEWRKGFSRRAQKLLVIKFEELMSSKSFVG